ncbi:E3 ubiquitin-protein ligase RFI2-like [Nicotiana tomentosiformis]|uniref:E3 ubiquitin-protein ligase RFI2-like n=1 Tax=Nicotiana tomentosiformis TaxID=4098 RepID=UPI00388CACE8
MASSSISFPNDINNAPLCSICLEAVLDNIGRSITKLHCGHFFHTDCIGSEFNARGTMQCPNCRTVEDGNWLLFGDSEDEESEEQQNNEIEVSDSDDDDDEDDEVI